MATENGPRGAAGTENPHPESSHQCVRTDCLKGACRVLGRDAQRRALGRGPQRGTQALAYFSGLRSLVKSMFGIEKPDGRPPGGSAGCAPGCPAPCCGRPKGDRAPAPERPPFFPLRLFFDDRVADRRAPGSPIWLPICFIILRASKKRSTSWLTSLTVTPERLAIRSRREALMILGSVRSVGVMPRMIAVI